MDSYGRMGYSAHTTIVNARRGDLAREAAEARILRATPVDEYRAVVGRSVRRRVVSFFERQVRPFTGALGHHVR